MRTPGGWKAIEQVLPGDLVLAAPDSDPESAAEAKTVLRVYANPPDRLIGVHAGGQVIRVTLHHPFYVRGAGWTGASRLRPGDQLLSHDGSWLSVTEIYDDGDLEPVYNLCVQDHHTYFVGEPAWGFSVLVHNESGDMKDAAGVGAAAKRDPAAEGGRGIKFSDGEGPIRIVGIVGNVEEKFVDSNNRLGLLQTGVGKMVRSAASQLKVPMNFKDASESNVDMYTATPGSNLTLPAETIAKQQFDKIKKDLDNDPNLLKDGKVYRVLLIGYSYGGDKAIEVTNALYKLLKDNHLENSVEIHLRTIDAVNPNSPPGQPFGASPTTKGPVDGAAASWHNWYQTGDSGALRDSNGNAIPLKGALIPGAKNHPDLAPMLLRKKVGTNSFHTSIDEVVKSQVMQSLGLN